MREFLKKIVSKVFQSGAGLTLALILVFLALPACSKKSSTQATNTTNALSGTAPIVNNSATQNASVSNNSSIPEQNVVSSSTPATISNISVSNSPGLSVGPPTATNGTAPLITQTMTAQERAEYLKEKGIPIITKANFKKPELLWEKTFNKDITSFDTEITNDGNMIIVAGKTMYFLDSKGNIRNKIPVKEHQYEIAKGSYGAVLLDKWNEKAITLSYYDEFGNKKWTKKIKLAGLAKLQISDNGATIAVAELGPWSPEGWRAQDLNVARILFFDNKGNQIYQYGKFRSIGAGTLSGDGRYYAAEVFWQNGFNVHGKLIYFDLVSKKILWQRPFEGYITTHDYFIDYQLVISRDGSYVAVNDESPSWITKNAQASQVDVFTKDGEFIAISLVGGGRITDDGLMEGSKGWVDIKKMKATGLIGTPPYFLGVAGEIVWAYEKGIGKVGHVVSQKLVSLNGQVLFKKSTGGRMSITKNYDYLVNIDGKEMQVYKLHINRTVRSGHE